MQGFLPSVKQITTFETFSKKSHLGLVLTCKGYLIGYATNGTTNTHPHTPTPMKPLSYTFRLDYEQLALDSEASAFRALLLVEEEKRPAHKRALKRIYKAKKGVAVMFRFEATKSLATQRQAEQNQATA